MSDIITNTTNTNDCKVFKVYLSKYTAANISSSNEVINNSTVNGINVTNALNNLQNTKLDKGTYVGTAQDLKNDINNLEGKNIAQDDLINDLSSEIAYENVRNDSQDSRLENLEGINYIWSPTNRTLTLFDRENNQLSQVSLVSLDNEGTDLRYNSTTLSLELYNADNELLDSIPVSSFIGSVGTQLQLNSNELQLKDSQGNVLSTVSFTVSNIQGLQTALDGKLDKGTYTGNAQDLKNAIDSKANTSHTHDISNVTNLQTTLNNKLDKGTYIGTAQELKKDIDGIQIGGRNLISTNCLIDSWTEVSDSTGSFTRNYSIGYKNTNSLRLQCTGSFIFRLNFPIIKEAGYHTISFWYKPLISSYSFIPQLNDTYLINAIDGSISSTWKYYSSSVYINSLVGINGFIDIELFANSDILISDIKVERGNKATDWTPAPEDKQDNLQTITDNVGVGKTNTSATEKLDVNGNVKATSFIKSGGTSTQILMADGSVIEKSTIGDNQTLSTSIDNNGRYLSISGGNQISIDSRLIHVLDSPNRSPNDPIFYPNVTPKSVRFDFIASNFVSGTGNFAGLMTFSPYDGTTNSTGDSSYQLAFYNQTGVNGTGIPGLKIRKGIDTTWNNWYKIYTDGDFSQSNIDNWNTAFSWGNHAIQGYLKSSDLSNYVTTNTPQIITGHKEFLATSNSYYQTSLQVKGNGSTIFPGIGFHQPGIIGNQLNMGNDGWFQFVDGSNSNYVSLRVKNITSNGMLTFSNNEGGVYGVMGDNDFYRIWGRSTSSNQGYLEISTADDGNEPIIVSQYIGQFINKVREAKLLDENGNTSFPGRVSAPELYTSVIFGTWSLNVLTPEGHARSVKSGGLLASSSYADEPPSSGIMSRGLNYFHNQLDGQPSISVAIGDTDTGFNWESDGVISYYANAVKLFNLNNVFHTGNFNPSSKADVFENATGIGLASGQNPNTDNTYYPYFYSTYGLIPLATRKWVADNYIPKSHPVYNVTQANVNNWNTAFDWGNHASVGYALANGANATNNWGNTSSGLALNPNLSGKTLNDSGQNVHLRDATYGQISGIVQDSTNGPEVNQWSNRLKTLHNSSAGYFTELAQSFTGTEGVWHRRNSAGTISPWKRLYDDSIWNAASMSYSGSTLTLTINGISKTATINAGTNYTLPTASASTLGGVKIGSGISIDGNGVISANAYTAGTNITISSNQISVVASPTFSGNVTATSFFESSLRKYKTNIKKFDKSGIDLIDSLEIVTFDRIDSDVKSKIGIIADDSPEEFLSENKDAIDLYKTIFIQSKAIQELNAKNLELEERLIKLEKLLSNG